MTEAPVVERRTVVVQGIVQGVGFRPFVYSLAHRYGLAGTVRNNAEGVVIEVEGSPEMIELFLRQVHNESPPLAVVESLTWQAQSVRGDSTFRIEESRAESQRQALISPDVSTCARCLQELFDPVNRRFRYPFINCTNCGPRFTITLSVPYDRCATTMASFTMCCVCRREYDDPLDRRFHAQPNACFDCGPQVRLVDRYGNGIDRGERDAVGHAATLLRSGAIVAIKGLGGFHLACLPYKRAAVSELRNRKVRQDKPFALMARDVQQARELCMVSPAEEVLLTSPARPIVLLDRREETGERTLELAAQVAPRQKTLGVMLAYTPLHHLLLHDIGLPLVMTSGNRSDEPIAYREEEAFEQLGDIADYFLVHDRPIHMRCDDSVIRHFALSESRTQGCDPYPVRRSRGFAPVPLKVQRTTNADTLACGAELKNTFCLTRGSHAFVSHHIGDLQNYESLQSYREGIEHYCRLFDVHPQVVACDLHPEYLSTKYAHDLADAGLSLVEVQHHHAHIAACLAENERPADERVIGVAFDGTGYGTDGTLWGGEFLEGSILDGFVRRAHLAYAQLPGGEAAIRQPWRIAIARLLTLYGEEGVAELPLPVVHRVGARRIHQVRQMIEADGDISWLTPQSSSAGRLFDVIAALLGVPGAMQTTYEGQAAIELELVASGPVHAGYPCAFQQQGGVWVADTGNVVAAVVEDMRAGVSIQEISARFHRTMADVVVSGCRTIRHDTGVCAVALSGGTFQNVLLLQQAVHLLCNEGFSVYLHHRVPANDGGISLGQAVLADSAVRRLDG